MKQPKLDSGPRIKLFGDGHDGPSEHGNPKPRRDKALDDLAKKLGESMVGALQEIIADKSREHTREDVHEIIKAKGLEILSDYTPEQVKEYTAGYMSLRLMDTYQAHLAHRAALSALASSLGIQGKPGEPCPDCGEIHDDE